MKLRLNKVFGSTAETRRQKVKRQLTEKRRHEIEESLQLLGERSLVIVPDSVVQGRVDDDAQLTDQLKQNNKTFTTMLRAILLMKLHQTSTQR